LFLVKHESLELNWNS